MFCDRVNGKYHLMMVLAAVAGSVAAAAGSDWANWRGPYLNGSAAAVNLPETLTPEKAAWSVDLPGPAASTPVVANGRLFLTSTEKDSEQCLGMCVDAANGTCLWQKPLTSSTQRFPRNTAASPSPVADAERVYFLFGNGQLVGLDHTGKELWRRNLVAEFGSLSIKFGYSSSPLLLDNILYVLVLRRPTVYSGPAANKPLASFLLAVDTQTGKTVFYQERPSDAVDETTNSYTTPVAAVVSGQRRIVVFGADYLTAHDPQTGREWMRYPYDTSKGVRHRNIPTPVPDGSQVFGILPRGGACVAVDLAAPDKPLLWQSKSAGPDSSSPALYRGYLYMIEDNSKQLVCLDAAAGTIRWKGQLDRSAPYYASVTAADDKLYLVNQAGAVTVAAADPNEYRELSTTLFHQAPTESTIVTAAGRVYLRTATTLYCFETPAN